MQKKQTDPTSAYLGYVLITLLMVGSVVAWQAWRRTASFDRFHHQLAITTVQGSADEIQIMFGELRRSMQLFAIDRLDLLEAIRQQPDDNALWSRLETSVQEHFPEVFGLTLTDAEGNVLHPDFEGHVSEVCQTDIRQFINDGYRNQGVIHPNPLGYHFDIMVPWGNPQQPQGVFFLGFQPALLQRILQRLQPPEHQLILLNRIRPGLIEVTAQGTRETLQRDFFLSAVERAGILATLPIADTRWDIVDLPGKQLLHREAMRNWVYAAVIFGVFAIVTLLMLYQLRRKERFRIEAEQRALQHENELAHVDRLNTLGEMASGVAHELNQPLTAISTYCQSALRLLDSLKDPPAKLLMALEAASHQAKRAGDILHRMRAFAAKGKVQPRAMDLNRLITEATDFIRPELNRQDIRLQLDLAGGLPAVMADGTQIEQVVLNLMNNAIRAMQDNGSGIRRLTVSTRLADDGQIETRISDTGTGIDPAIRDRIFDTFFSSTPGGMGLGLAISRSIIETHGGQLLVEEQATPGVTFCFRLPAAEQ